MTQRPGLPVGPVVGVGVGCAAVVYVAARWWYRRGGTWVDPSWPTALVLLALAALLVGAGRRIAATRAGTTTRPVHPIGAYRTVLVAQAAALTGAVVAGGHVGVVGALLPDVDFPSVRSDAVLAAVMSVSGVALGVAGLWVQRVCRIDPGDGDGDGDDAEDGAASTR